ncbi:MAG: RHS repeat domain-containing protein [Telluria sp.]|nr:RHS repeat domain-containing protein [Telluria sp.]
MSLSIPGSFRRRFVSIILTAWLPALLCAPRADAQDTTTAKEHVKLIRAQRDMAVLGKDLFGDRVNLYTGSLEFVQTDVSLPGNSALPVSVGRRLVAGDNPIVGTLFGRWDLEIPHLHGIFSKSRGWVSSGDNSGARCSAFGEPPQVNGSYGSVSRWKGTEYWHGSFLYVPGVGDQEMLGRTANYMQAPGNQRSIYPIVTRNNWAIRCLAAMDPKNGGTGEAFVAVAPDGTEYRFDWIVSRPAPELSKASSGPATSKLPAPGAAEASELGANKGKPSPDPSVVEGNVLARQEVWILPTLITDRFGNTVSYTYDTTNKWQLTKIESNDATGSPRVISLTYETPASVASNLVSSVNDGTRTWTYSYDTTIAENANLTGVTLPDQSRWDLTGVAPLLFSVDYLGSGSCDTPGVLNPVQLFGYMTHPSGARGDFTLTPTYHGRSGVEEQCDYDVETETYSPYYPKIFSSNALTRKTLSGPGLSPMEWSTTYSAQASSWAPCNACETTKQVLVTEPSGDKTRFTFGTLFRQTEGQLQQTDVIESNGSVIRSTQQRYAEPVPPFGVSYQRRGDGELASRVMETDRRIISQQGVEFTWLASQFNSFAKPTNVTRSSPLGSRAETTEYENNLSKWVLGQIKQVKENSTGKVMVLNEYDPATATLKKVTRFGKLEQTLTYYADGTLDTQMDGLNQSTKFSNYKRGQAQAVRYHNGSTESAVVNNIGAVDSVTDAAGYTTAYGYDAMGRRNLITPPAGDTVIWNPTRIVYSQVPTVPFDLSAGGYWRRQVTTGSAYTTTYYDALWREIYDERADNDHVNETRRITKRQYDAAGRLAYESYLKRSYGEIADGIYYEYDALGRPTVTGTITELGIVYSGFSYQSGFQKTYTDARQHNTTYSYQAFDAPDESAITSIVAPEGVSVAIARDLFDKPQTIIRSGNGKSATRSYVYDTYERLCKTIEPETGATVQHYDARTTWPGARAA